MLDFNIFRTTWLFTSDTRAFELPTDRVDTRPAVPTWRHQTRIVPIADLALVTGSTLTDEVTSDRLTGRPIQTRWRPTHVVQFAVLPEVTLWTKTTISSHPSRGVLARPVDARIGEARIVILAFIPEIPGLTFASVTGTGHIVTGRSVLAGVRGGTGVEICAIFTPETRGTYALILTISSGHALARVPAWNRWRLANV